MTSNEFKRTRILRLKVNQRELATLMDTPLRTIQSIEAQGDTEIRGVYAVCLQLLIERHRWAMAETLKSLDARLDRDYPNGIASEPAEKE